MNNLVFESATKLMASLKTGDLSSEELLTAYYEQIKKYNPKINAIVELEAFEKSLELAKAIDQQRKSGIELGPLAGLPMTVKECYNVAGMVSTNGNPALLKNRASEDAALVKILKKAGAIIIGKTNLPYLIMDWQSTNKWYGQTNNPYHLDHVAGGSSGGSAAALAAGFSPLEMGSDSGGSIRVPAHFCGVTGLRPTEGALVGRGHIVMPKMPRISRYITVCGPIARNVEDLTFLTELCWNNQKEYAEVPPVAFKSSDWEEGDVLRIAYSKTLDGVELDAEYEAIYLEFIKKLNAHQPKDMAPNFDNDEMINLWGKILGHDMQSNIKAIPFLKWAIYFYFKKLYKDNQWAKGIKDGVGLNARGYAAALEQKDEVRDQFIQFFKNWDIWLTPVAGIAAYQHMKSGSKHFVNGKKQDYTRPFTPFNFATALPGHPIVVIPIGKTSKGLPVGVQIHAAPWHDHKLLKISKYLEGFTKGFERPSFG